MRETIGLARANDSRAVERARPWWRRRLLLLFAVGWTVFVGLALWWLVRGNPDRSVWIVHEANSPAPKPFERRHAIFRADSGFQQVCPWILLSPYVAMVAMCFPLERGRLRLGLPLNLAACAVFIAGSHVIGQATRVTFMEVTIISAAAQGGKVQTNLTQVEIRSSQAGELVLGPTAKNPDRGGRAGSDRLDRALGLGGDVAYASLTNLMVQMHPGSKAPPRLQGMQNWRVWSSLLDLLAYGAVAGLAHAVHFYRRFREREHRALVLESNLANARLDVLRAQLQPHFLFNSLNAIAALLRRDPRLAEATLMSLSELLRLALRQSERQEIALREELEFVRRYLEIQQTRFGDRLRVEEDIEAGALDCAVPALLVQPLVENAIRHGLEPDGNAGLVRLTAHERGGRLVLTVEDDGAGFAAIGGSAPVGTGIGLANLRARLKALYGTGQALELGPRAGGGVTVRIEMPWRAVTPAETPNG